MLKLFRQKKIIVQSLLFFIVFLVGVAMLVYLVPGAGAGRSLRDPQGLLARVGDLPLTRQEVERAYDRTAEQMGTRSPQFRRLILEQLLEELLTQQMVVYEAGRLGIQVTPEEVAVRLRQVPTLYPGGQFVGVETYRRLVQQQFRMSVPEFEETFRQQVLLSKVLDWVTAGLTVSPAEVEQAYRRRHDRVQVEFIVFRPDEFARGLQPTEPELRATFERQHGSYQVPARRAVRYAAIDYAALSQRLRVTPAELEDYYQRNRDTYHLPERVRARHILFLLRPEAGQTAVALRKKAEDVLAQLRRGQDFAALARKSSDDSSTREHGGEIGWVQRGQTVPALEQALFSLAPGSPAQSVETGYGFHVVQVLEHEPERVRPLAEVRGEIEPLLKDEKVRQAAQEEARRLVAAVRGGKPFTAAAQEAGWPILETPLFRKDEPIGAFAAKSEFQEAAFSLPGESPGQPAGPVSEPVAVPPGYAVLQLKEDSPARPARLEEVRAQVGEAWRRERGLELARDAAHQLAVEAEKRGGLRAAAQALGRPVKTSPEFGRDGFVPELGAARDLAPVAFSLPVGGLSPALPTGGTWVVFRVFARQEGDLAKMTDDERRTTRSALLEQKRGLAWAVFRENLKKKLLAEGKLKLNQAAIDHLIGKS